MLNLALLLPHLVTSDMQTSMRTEVKERECFLELWPPPCLKRKEAWQSLNRAFLLSLHLLSGFRKVTYQFKPVSVNCE